MTQRRAWMIGSVLLLTASALGAQVRDTTLSVPLVRAGQSRPEPRQWLSQATLPFNIKDFGATGNGTTDDGAAIQAAITAAITTSGGAAIGTAAIFVPGGTFAFSSTLDITKPLLIYGVPGGTSTLLYTGAGTAIIWEHAVISGGTQVTQYPFGAGMRDITLQGPGAGTAATVGVLCGNNNSTASTIGAAFWNLKIMQFRVGFSASNGCNLISVINGMFVNDSMPMYLPSGATNAGEGLGFDHMVFANATGTATSKRGVVIGVPWEFECSRCSFDAAPFIDSSSSIVRCDNCHFENSGVVLNYDMLTVQNGDFTCINCLFSNDDVAATDSQFVQVNGTNAIFSSLSSIFQNPGGAPTFPSRAIEVSLGKHVTLINSILNANILTREWQVGASSATFGVESYGSFNPGVPFAGPTSIGIWQPLTYSASVNVNPYRGTAFLLAVTNGTAFTMNLPAPVPNNSYQVLMIDVFNNSGGVMGAVTWTGGANGYRLAGAWTSPATGNHRLIAFYFSQSTGSWYELWRSAADVPN